MMHSHLYGDSYCNQPLWKTNKLLRDTFVFSLTEDRRGWEFLVVGILGDLRRQLKNGRGYCFGVAFLIPSLLQLCFAILYRFWVTYLLLIVVQQLTYFSSFRVSWSVYAPKFLLYSRKYVFYLYWTILGMFEYNEVVCSFYNIKNQTTISFI